MMAVPPPVRLALMLGPALCVLACTAGQQPSAVMIGGDSPRQAIHAEVGDWQLTCLKNPQPGTKCRLQISVDGSLAEPDFVFDSIDSLISAMRLDHAGQAQFLRLVLMQVLPAFGLMADEKLAKAIGESLGKAPFLAGSATLCAVTGQSYSGIVLPAGCTIDAGDTTLLIGSTCQFGRLRAVEEWIGLEAGKVLEAVLSLDSPPMDGCLLVLVKSQGLICFSLSWNGFEDFGSLAAQFTRHASALPSLMALHAPPEVLVNMNSSILRSQAGAQAVRASACEFALSIGVMICLPAGIFVSGWVHDPDRCLAAIHLLDHSLRDPDLVRQWLTHGALIEVSGSAKAVTGFCGFVRRTDGAGWLHRTPLLVRLANGEHHVATAACGPPDLLEQRSALLDAVTPAALSGDGFAEVFGPAMAAIQDSLVPRSKLAGTRRFGKPSWRSSSIIIPLYRQLDFLRSQLLSFAIDSFVREQCEIVYVLDDPALEGQVANILGGFAQFAELDLALAVMSENGGYARANNLAVDIASGVFLVLMNSDVVPESVRWLEPCLEALGALPDFSVVGPKLLYADQSLQHAGMYFYRLPDGQWQNMHYFKGFGRDFPAARQSREVPAVTGAVMVLTRENFRAIGGFSTSYVIGDYEDSDLCLRLRERGGRAFYLADVALYHFERQSMGSHQAQSDSGSTAFNRALHHHRWSKAIATTMADTAFRKGADVS